MFISREGGGAIWQRMLFGGVVVLKMSEVVYFLRKASGVVVITNDLVDC